MTSYSSARVNMLLAFFIRDYQHHSPYPAKNLYDEYSMDFPESWIEPILENLKDQNHLNRYADDQALLIPERHSQIEQTIVDTLDTGLFEIDTGGNGIELITENDPPQGLVFPDGVVWRNLNSEAREKRGMSGDYEVNHYSQNGKFYRILTSDEKTEVLRLLEEAEQQVQKLHLDNRDRAQALSLLKAAISLAEAPEPPRQAIWDLVDKLNNIAGVASLLVALTALLMLE